MKKSRFTMALLVSLIGISSSGAQADDYTQFSNEQLIEMRGELHELSDSERNAFRNEMQTRMQSLDSTEREALRGMTGANSGQGSMTRSRLRDDSGGGQQYGGSRGGGGGGRR